MSGNIKKIAKIVNNINIQLVVYRVFPKHEDILFVHIGCVLQLILKDYLQMSGRLVSYDALVIAFTHVNFTVGRNFTSSCHVSYLYWYSTAKSLQLLIYGAYLFIITGPMTQDPKICHMVYFKLKELVQVQAGFSDLPLKQVMRPSHERRPPYTWRREHPDFLGHRT